MENSLGLDLIVLEENPVREKHSSGGLEKIVLKKPIENVFSSNAASSAYILALRDLALKLNVYEPFLELLTSNIANDEDREKLKTLLSIRNSSIPKDLSYVNAPTFALAYEFLYPIFKDKGFDFDINDFLIVSSLNYYKAHIRIIGAFLPFDTFMNSLQVDLKKLTDAISIDVEKKKTFFGREYSFVYRVKKSNIEELSEYFSADFIKMHVNHNAEFTKAFLALLPVLFVDMNLESISENGIIDIAKFKGRIKNVLINEAFDSDNPFTANFDISYPNIPYRLRFKTGIKRLFNSILPRIFPSFREKEIYRVLSESYADNISAIGEVYSTMIDRIRSRVDTSITAIDFLSSLFNIETKQNYASSVKSVLEQLSSIRNEIHSSEEKLHSLPSSFTIDVLKEYLGDNNVFLTNKTLEKIRNFYNDPEFLKFLDSKLKERIGFEGLEHYTNRIITLFGEAYNSIGVSEQPEILNSMIERVDEVDAFKGHSSRVGELFSLLAEEYKVYTKSRLSKNLNDDEVKSFREFNAFDFETLNLIGALHDIGKLFVRTEVLKKPFRLSDEEFFEIQQHTVLGYKLLEAMGLSDVFKYSALYHHKNYSSEGFGANYPKGKGFHDFIVDVPFSNIVSLLRIADSIDAIAASFIDRDYDKKRHFKTRTVVDAVETIIKEFGTTYNPLFEEFFYDRGKIVVLSFYEELYRENKFSKGLLAIENYNNS